MKGISNRPAKDSLTRPADDSMVARLGVLRDEARTAREELLAHIIEIAIIEAELIVERATGGRTAADRIAMLRSGGDPTSCPGAQVRAPASRAIEAQAGTDPRAG